MGHIYWDIETIGNDRAAAYYAAKVYEAPSNYVDPVKIAKYIEEKRAEDAKRAGLTWWTGAVCCICAESDDGSSFSEVNADEPQLLTNFFDWCRKQEAASDVTYLGKNALDFDGPFVVGRALAHSLKLPYKLCGKGHKSPLLDIDRIWGYRRGDGQVGKLSDFAWGLGIHPKSAHGSQVQSMWDRSEHAEIKSYCQDDVRIVKEIYKRWRDCTE